MEIDFLLPASLFLIITLAILFCEKIEKRMRIILEDKKLSIREIILMIASMGVMVAVVALMPSYAIQILFIAAYSYLLLIFTYVLSGKWLLAVFPPIVFVSIYFLTRDISVMNIFAALFAIMIITYLNSLFSWRITWAFAMLLTVMDVIQVFWTGYMGEAARKMMSLYLPVVITFPTYPSFRFTALGLGDVFLSGLLSAQTASKYGRKAGFLIAAVISIIFFAFEIFMLNTDIGIINFPATVIVLSGWLLGMGFIFLKRKRSTLLRGAT